MLLDGLQLTDTGTAENFIIDSGTAFPAASRDGELFILTLTYAGNLPGVYFFNAGSSSWKHSSTPEVSYQGSYSAGITYKINSIVTSGTGIYLSITDLNVGNLVTNSANWVKLNIGDSTYGYAKLNAANKIETSYLPDTILGALTYSGVWNASTNSPALLAAVGNTGNYYVVNVSGTSMVDGVSVWSIGDWVVSNGTAWDKISNTSAVTSVAGRTGDIVLAKADVGLPNVDNTPDTAKPVSSAAQTALDLKIDTAKKGVASGVCPLGTDSKVPASYLPDSVTGGLKYQGNWNASTNSPAIPTAATANKGFYYMVATAGTTAINGISSWAVGDWVVSNGTVWEKVASSATVASVNGRLGAIVLAKSDVGLSNVDNTSDVNKPVSSDTQAALDLKAPTANPTFTGTVSGVSKTMVGLSNVDNTSDTAKPVSTTTQTALDSLTSGLSSKIGLTAVPYDLASAILGAPGAAASILRFVAVRAFTIPQGMTGSTAQCGVAPTGTQTLTLKKNGTSFATIVFAPGATIATFTATVTSFASGDVLTIDNQATADTTFASCGFTVAATLI